MAGEQTTALSDLGWLYHPTFPDSWRRSKLYPLAGWTNGMAFRNINFSVVGRPVIKIAEIKNGISGQTQFTDAEYDSDYLVRKGDMLFSWSGQPESSIDAFWWRGPEGWLNQHVFKVQPDRLQCRADFFFYLLKYLKPIFIGIARNKQTTGLGHVTKKDLEEIEVRLPGEALQRAIAHILGTLDDKIEMNRRMNETLEAMARALFKSWFVDFDPVRAKQNRRSRESGNPEIKDLDARFLGHDGCGLPKPLADLFPDSFEDSELGEIPKGWKIEPLSEITTVITKGTTPTQSETATADKDDGEVNYVRVNAIDEDGTVLFEKLTTIPESVHLGILKRSVLQAGDVLYTIAGTIGRSAIVDESLLPANTNQAIAIIRPKQPIPPAFLVMTMRAAAFREELHSNIVHAVQANLSLGMLSRARTVVPPKNNLLQLFMPIADLAKRVASARAESRTLAALRDMMLPKLISGELRIEGAKRIIERATA